MTKHESKMQELAATKLGGPRFSALIRRHEMNIEPPPKEEEKVVDKSVASSHLRFSVLTVPRPVPGGPRRWGQGRLLEAEEEDYFNSNDDDEEDSIVPVPRATNIGGRQNGRHLRISVPGQPPLKRPRHVPSQLRPQSPLSSLLDYDDDDDVTSPSLQQGSSSLTQLEDGPVQHRQIEIPPYDPSAEEKPSSDPEDDILEALVTKPKGGDGATAPSKSTPKSSSPPSSTKSPSCSAVILWTPQITGCL